MAIVFLVISNFYATSVWAAYAPETQGQELLLKEHSQHEVTIAKQAGSQRKLVELNSYVFDLKPYVAYSDYSDVRRYAIGENYFIHLFFNTKRSESEQGLEQYTSLEFSVSDGILIYVNGKPYKGPELLEAGILDFENIKVAWTFESGYVTAYKKLKESETSLMEEFGYVIDEDNNGNICYHLAGYPIETRSNEYFVSYLRTSYYSNSLVVADHPKISNRSKSLLYRNNQFIAAQSKDAKMGHFTHTLKLLKEIVGAEEYESVSELSYTLPVPVYWKDYQDAVRQLDSELVGYLRDSLSAEVKYLRDKAKTVEDLQAVYLRYPFISAGQEAGLLYAFDAYVRGNKILAKRVIQEILDNDFLLSDSKYTSLAYFYLASIYCEEGELDFANEYFELSGVDRNIVDQVTEKLLPFANPLIK